MFIVKTTGYNKYFEMYVNHIAKENECSVDILPNEVAILKQKGVPIFVFVLMESDWNKHEFTVVCVDPEFKDYEETNVTYNDKGSEVEFEERSEDDEP